MLKYYDDGLSLSKVSVWVRRVPRDNVCFFFELLQNILVLVSQRNLQIPIQGIV